MDSLDKRFEQACRLLEQGGHVQATAELQALAEHGHVEAMLRLADLYMKGVGVERDLDQALALLGAAVNAGSAVAEELFALVEQAKAMEFDQACWSVYG